jgi:hypothetical protein
MGMEERRSETVAETLIYEFAAVEAAVLGQEIVVVWLA